MIKFKTEISVFILVLFHVIGIGGVWFGDASSFLLLTPLNLLLTLAIILWNHSDWKKWWVFAITYIVGLAIEIVGIQTGWPFGVYSYSHVLGPKILETPLIIGVNWLILLYATNSIANRIGPNMIARVLISATLMTFIDVLIEPVAINVNFWTWENPDVPITNYISWFIISGLLSIIWQYRRVELSRPIGFAVFLVQILFFSALTLLA